MSVASSTSSSISSSDINTHWKVVRSVLKEGLLGGAIPVEPKAMKPKAVYQIYAQQEHESFLAIPYGDKFTRTLRALRKKHMNGDLENEDKPKAIVWRKSAAKQVLKQAFRSKLIPSDYTSAENVWNEHCKDHDAFKRMEFDDAFVRRLKTVKEDYEKKLARSLVDLNAFNLAKKNHPTPEFDFWGRPQWHGSKAQELLKDLIKHGKYKGMKPADLWASKEEWKVYDKRTFRDHIYQEERLIKFQRYVELLKQKKTDALQY